MLPRILLALAATATLSLPAIADGNGLAALTGTSWRLLQLDGGAVAPDITSTLIISADSIGGNGGCNTYGGDLAETATGIDITQVFSTMMACDGLAQEQAFFAALEAPIPSPSLMATCACWKMGPCWPNWGPQTRQIR